MAGDGWPCEDGVFCNGSGTCTEGRCVQRIAGFFFDDPCWVWSCDEARHSGGAIAPSPAGTPCRHGPGDCLAATCDGAGACTDLAVPLCPAECCTNLRDDDGDEAVDCEDPDCLDDPACTPCREGPEICWDGCDNDADGRTDVIDDDCRYPSPCIDRACRPGPELCENRCDDDRDGLPDCVDPDCAADPACSSCVPDAEDEDAPERCTDGVDNDCDGFADCCDWPDGGCPYAFTCDYVRPEDCNNALDDDIDGLTDCDSPVCAGYPGCTCSLWAPEDCANGIDDDMDGRTDGADFECPRECS
jgi:hypothetical protein